MYYLQSRYYDPVMKRMICADNEAITAESTLKDNNIFTYCDNNPVNNKNEEGDVWQLALAGGPSGASAAIAVAGSITPAGWIALGVAATVTAGVVAYSHYRTRNTIMYSKEKSRYSREHKKRKSSKKKRRTEKEEKNRDNIARRVHCKSRKEALERAQRAGKKKKPDKHAGDKKNAHFHPAIKRKERDTYNKRVTKHDHYYYPRRR